eukprot:11466473-Heterocapsa_arctica.AAC.1
MVDGKDTRKEVACLYHASGNCRKGADCPWSHAVSEGATAAAASSSDKRAACHQFEFRQVLFWHSMFL